MKFAILSDVHANLEALQAVLADSMEQSCAHHVFLGDFVGYCADPKACVDIVRAMNAPCVKGNHDEYCSTDMPLDDFNPKAANVVQWTRDQLAEDDLRWMRELPLVRSVDGFTVVHATLEGPERWGYVFDKLAAAASLTHQNTQVCFYGHTHVPLVFVRDGLLRGGTYTKFKLESGKRYFVNVGAVGQPRDDNPNAAYVIYDNEERTVELRRVPYDTAAAERKVRQAGLS